RVNSNGYTFALFQRPTSLEGGLKRAIAVVVVCAATAALGSKFGRSSDEYTPAGGCNDCHGGGVFTPTVTLTGPVALTSGQLGTFKVRVSTANGTTAGF